MRKYTWKPDIPDVRDHLFEAPKISLPTKVDLRNKYNKIYDQSDLGSCTANSISMAIDFERVNQKMLPIIPSRLFIYYNERVMENSVKQDSGAQIRDGVKSVATQGACTETLWPYVINKFKNKPTKTCYTQASTHLIKQYVRLDNTDINQLKSCLASGYGFVFGFSVYQSFESDAVAKTGIVPMPSKNEQLLGGHAVFCLGYDDSKQWFIVRNSWGPDWGDKGHFYIPYTYLTNNNLSDDFWTIRLV